MKHLNASLPELEEPPIKTEPVEPADPRRSEPDREDPERAEPEKVDPERPQREEPERPERAEPMPFRAERRPGERLRAAVVAVLGIVLPGAINKGGHPGAMLGARAVFWRGE